MAIKREELTPEQIIKLEKLYRRYMLKMALTALLYVGFSFFANVFVIIIDTLYIHSPQFVFLSILGTAVLVFNGIRGTVDEHRDILVEEIKKIVGHL